MKLYTEEQLKEFFKEHYFFMERDLENLTPIELPSDDEIKQKVELILSYDKNREEEEAVSAGFALGAKWAIDYIKQQDNGK